MIILNLIRGTFCFWGLEAHEAQSTPTNVLFSLVNNLLNQSGSFSFMCVCVCEGDT